MHLALIVLFCLQDPVPFTDEALSAQGKAIVDQAVKAAGGWEQWQKVEGMTFARTVERRQARNLLTRTRTDVMLDPRGRGSIRYRHLVEPNAITSDLMYQEFFDGVRGWNYQRRHHMHRAAAENARERVRRELFLSTLPFSLVGEDIQVEGVGVADAFGAQRIFVRLPRGIRMERSERVTDFEVSFDHRTYAIRSVRYMVQGDDVVSMNRGVHEEMHRIEFGRLVPAGAFRFPSRRTLRFDTVALASLHEMMTDYEIGALEERMFVFPGEEGGEGDKETPEREGEPGASD